MHLGGQASWVWILHSAIISAMIPHLCLSKMSQRSLLHSSNFFRSELLLPIDFYIWFTALLPAPPFTAASSFSILWSSVTAGSLLCKPSKDMDLFFLKKKLGKIYGCETCVCSQLTTLLHPNLSDSNLSSLPTFPASFPQVLPFHLCHCLCWQPCAQALLPSAYGSYCLKDSSSICSHCLHVVFYKRVCV